MNPGASTVNSIETPATGGSESADSSRPIVSVNEGPRPKTPLTFWLFMSVGAMVIVALLFYLVSRISVRDTLMPGAHTATQKPQGTPVDPPDGLDKPFEVTAGPATAASAPLISVAPVGADAGRDRPCLPRPVRDPTGAPIMGSDGKPLMVACDGTSMPSTMPTVSIAGVSTPPGATVGTTGAAGNAAPAMVRRDRYGGSVKNEPAPATPGQLSSEQREALEVMKRVEAQRASAPEQARTTTPATGGFFSAVAGGPGIAATPAATVSGSQNSRNLSRVSTVDETPRHVAKRLERARYVAVRGSQVECNLTLAYVSDIAGEAHCVIARDVYGQDGSTILIDRGSVANGSFQAVNALGERRAYVIWDRLVTPAGVVATLASKGTDALGSTGMAAKVDNRWLDRVGVALAISLVKDATAAYAASRAASGSQLVSTSQGFGDQVLGQTIAIRPSLYLKQGSAASIVLQGDLDFADVYARR